MKLTNKVIPAAIFLSISGLASADVLLTATSSPNPVKVGGMSTAVFTLSDSGKTSNAVAGFQFDVDFNPAVLQAMAVTEEGYFASNGVLGLVTTVIDNKAGTIDLISDAAGTPEDPGKGDPLVDIAFSAVHSGSSPIDITNEVISGSQLNTIDSSAMDTTLNVPASVPEPRSFVLAGIGLLVAMFGTLRPRMHGLRNK